MLPPPPAEIRLSSGEEIRWFRLKLPPAVAGRPGQLVGLLAQGGLVLRVDDCADVGLDGGEAQGGRDEDPIPCVGDSADGGLDGGGGGERGRVVRLIEPLLDDA